jgi:hypothetical protein
MFRKCLTLIAKRDNTTDSRDASLMAILAGTLDWTDSLRWDSPAAEPEFSHFPSVHGFRHYGQLWHDPE